MRCSATVLLMSVFCASGAMAQGALTMASSLSPVGVQAGLDTMREADFRLTQNVRFRIESVQAASHSGPSTLLDPYGHRRRLASTVDFYPEAEGGFHFSLGMRSRPRFGRSASMSAASADLRTRLDAPAMTQALRKGDGIKRKSPVALIGWTEAVGDRSLLRLDGGAMAIRARKDNLLAMTGLSQEKGQSRIGATAQVSFIRKF